MQGLKLAREFFKKNKKVFQDGFPDVYDRIAFGLVGEGSECFGYDDEISKDHDFGPSFNLWMTEEDYHLYGTDIQKAYDNLLRDTDNDYSENHSVYGKNRRGVSTIETFYKNKTGDMNGPKTLKDWLFIPEYSLAEAVNGEVFEDTLGSFSKIRARLTEGFPEDVRKKKIAARAAMMAQSGQYNYRRCLLHGEEGAARLALSEFVKHTIQMIYLLNNKYCPYYKWMFKGMSKLPILGALSEGLTALLCAPDSDDNIQVKIAMIEQISAQIIEELKKQKLSESESDYLESHAFSVMETIEDEEIKSLHVMAGI